MRAACPLCASTYSAVGRPSCPLCAGAASVQLGRAVEVAGPAVVARAVQMRVGNYPEYARPEELAAAARQLQEAGLLEPPEPAEPEAMALVPIRHPQDRQRVGRLAGQLLDYAGLRPHRPPSAAQLSGRAARQGERAARAAEGSGGQPSLRILR